MEPLDDLSDDERAAATVVLELRESADVSLLVALMAAADDATVRLALEMLGDLEPSALERVTYAALAGCRQATR